jgi:hypothetical protein
MNRNRWILGAALFVPALVLAAPAARAGIDVSFGVNAPVGDDGHLFFSISSRYFDRDPHVVDTWAHRFPNPDDLAVFFHICAQSHVAPEVVWSYRHQGLSWFDVGHRCGLPVDHWYVPVAHAPGPPYGKAYGHWDKYQHDSRHQVRLSDRECRDLVAVRMAHEYYGVSPEVAMDWRRNGKDVRTIMTREYHERHHEDARSQEHHDDRHADHHGKSRD